MHCHCLIDGSLGTESKTHTIFFDIIFFGIIDVMYNAIQWFHNLDASTGGSTEIHMGGPTEDPTKMAL